MNIKKYIRDLGVRAQGVKGELASASSKRKNKAITAIAESIESGLNSILRENKKDVSLAKREKLGNAMIDRLSVNKNTINSAIEGLYQITKLKDPVGIVGSPRRQASGIKIGKMRVPIGVIGMIYESRPNVTIDATGLCLKSGNSVILKGGKESIYSNKAIMSCISTGLESVGFPRDIAQLVQSTQRSAVKELLHMDDYIDLIIPRGGKSLINMVSKESRIATLKHLDGICHVYVDKEADEEMAVKIVDNSKTQRFGTCNTLETLLVHEDRAPSFLPKIARRMNTKKVEIRADTKSQKFIKTSKRLVQKDWSTEYLAPILAVGVVPDVSVAINHINKFGSGHTDSIVTEDSATATKFLKEIDSSSVMVNASTRFADGFEYGLGAEIGISTDKLHARGPVGLEGLTSVKWIVYGTGQIRA